MTNTLTPAQFVHSNRDIFSEITKYMDMKTLSRYACVSRSTSYVAKTKLLFVLINSYMSSDIHMDELDYYLCQYGQDVNYPTILMYLLHKITISQAKKALLSMTNWQSRNIIMHVCQWAKYDDTNAYTEALWPLNEDDHRLAVLLFELEYCVDAIKLELDIIITCDGFDLILDSQLVNMMNNYIDHMLSKGLTLTEIGGELSSIKIWYTPVIETFVFATEYDHPEEREFIRMAKEVLTAYHVLWPDLTDN